MAIKILSVNCQGIGSAEKRLDVFNYLKSKQCDIYCLQDVHSNIATEQSFEKLWDNRCLFSSFSSNARGVAILFSKTIDYTIHDYISDPQGNYLIVDLTVDSNRFTLVSLYSPNVDSPQFYEEIVSKINTFGNMSKVLCGDFNLVQDPELDYFNYKCVNNIKSQKKLLEIKGLYNLIDPFRELNPDTKKFTWRRKNPLKMARLDFFLISENLLSSVNNCTIIPSYRSDHSIVILKLTFNPFKKGKPLWKHNNSLLQDIDYLNIIKNKITEVKEQYALPVYNTENINNIPNNEIQFIINDQLFLETLLMEIRGQSISYSSFKKKESEKLEKQLMEEIQILESNLTESVLEQLETKKDLLQNLRKIKMPGLLVRSRAQLIEDDEKPSQYFCSLETHNCFNKIIPKIEKDDGSFINDQNEILTEVQTFYQHLYSSRDGELVNTDLEVEFEGISVPKLNNIESISMEGLLTYEQAAIALKSMSNNRSPGTDGFSADFYKVFWKYIGHFVVRSINYGFINNELSITQKQGIITCIPKDNKSRYQVKNYRPISLLNCTYKIASGAIANRIKTVLDKLINKDQTGFLSGRYVGENTRILYDIMHYAEKHNMTGLLLLVDFEKAFDSLSWSFINTVMNFFGFGQSIIKWIEVLYKNATLAVTQGGNLSSFFNIERGCRQGDPLSPYLFILCSEILAIKIRNNMNIRGIKINNFEFKLSQYADDTSAILDGSESSLNETLNELSWFANISGLKVNFDKTQVVWIGRKKYSTDTIKTKWKLTWGNTEFKLLGIKFNVDLDIINKINYQEKITKIQKTIKQWKRRYLTPLGKITVIKTLLLPSLNHLFASLPNPDEQFLKKINDLFYDFLWKGPAKIKQSVIVKHYIEGGLKMINIKAFIYSFKATWIRRLLINEGKWTKIIEQDICFNQLLNNGNDFTNIIIDKISNPFWIDVLKTHNHLIKTTKINSIQDFLQLPIFYNENIKIGGRSIKNKIWINKGVNFINDIVSENGDLYTELEIKNIYNINTNFLELQGISRAVKQLSKNTKITLGDTKLQKPLIPTYLKIYVKSKKGCKDFYDMLNNNQEKPSAINKWQYVYNVSEESWKDIFMSPFKYKYSSDRQWFQVRINHRILPTKKYLHIIKVSDSPQCSYCTDQDETVSHLLWSCPVTQSFLQKIQCWFIRNNINIPFIEELFIFNIGNQYTPEDLLIILEIKYYIFSAKKLNSPLSIIALNNRLKHLYKSLKHNAIKNNILVRFERDWYKYDTILRS